MPNSAAAENVSQAVGEHNCVPHICVWTILHTIECTAVVKNSRSSPIEKRFGAVLRREREAAHLSQEALAEAAGLHRNYVGLLERGLRIPSILVVEKLASALTTTMAELIEAAESYES